MKLNARDAARLIEHMTKDKPNRAIHQSLVRGREIFKLMGKMK